MAVKPVAQPFDLPITVAPADVEELGHVNNVIYLRWVQQAASAHWRALAPPGDQKTIAWVVLRHEIDYKKPARAGDMLIARTWVGASTRLSYERHTQILNARDHEILAQARTLWCPIDAQSGRPTRISDEARSLFSSP
jgi:acyl-CoA thioester hydrolase